MEKNDLLMFEKLKGWPIYTKSFLSSSLKNTIAKKYALSNEEYELKKEIPAGSERVLFRISIDLDEKNDYGRYVRDISQY